MKELKEVIGQLEGKLSVWAWDAASGDWDNYTIKAKSSDSMEEINIALEIAMNNIDEKEYLNLRSEGLSLREVAEHFGNDLWGWPTKEAKIGSIRVIETPLMNHVLALIVVGAKTAEQAESAAIKAGYEEEFIMEEEKPREYKKPSMGKPRKRQLNLQLVEAVGNGDLDEVVELIEAGADPNTPGQTAQKVLPLFIAAENGNLDVVEFLVESGANVNVDYGSVLLAAARGGYTDVVKYLDNLIKYDVLKIMKKDTSNVLGSASEKEEKAIISVINRALGTNYTWDDIYDIYG